MSSDTAQKDDDLTSDTQQEPKLEKKNWWDEFVGGIFGQEDTNNKKSESSDIIVKNEGQGEHVENDPNKCLVLDCSDRAAMRDFAMKMLDQQAREGITSVSIWKDFTQEMSAVEICQLLANIAKLPSLKMVKIDFGHREDLQQTKGEEVETKENDILLAIAALVRAVEELNSLSVFGLDHLADHDFFLKACRDHWDLKNIIVQARTTLLSDESEREAAFPKQTFSNPVRVSDIDELRSVSPKEQRSNESEIEAAVPRQASSNPVRVSREEQRSNESEIEAAVTRQTSNRVRVSVSERRDVSSKGRPSYSQRSNSPRVEQPSYSSKPRQRVSDGKVQERSPTRSPKPTSREDESTKKQASPEMKERVTRKMEKEEDEDEPTETSEIASDSGLGTEQPEDDGASAPPEPGNYDEDVEMNSSHRSVSTTSSNNSSSSARRYEDNHGEDSSSVSPPASPAGRIRPTKTQVEAAY